MKRQATFAWRGGLAILAIAALASPGATQILLQGAEFQVNTYTTSYQSLPSVAGSDTGFVVVWSSYGQDAGNFGVFGKRFSSTGNPLGAEFQVNLVTVARQLRGRAAMTNSGFVVVWDSLDQDGSGYGVFGRRFNASGSPLGGEFQLSTRTAGNQGKPALAMDASGFVTVWEGDGDTSAEGVFGQRFGSTGAPVGPEFVVNTYVTGSQRYPAVAMDGSGFVVVWRSLAQDNHILSQRFDSQGTRQAGELQVSSRTVMTITSPAIERDALGFVVLWANSDGDSAGVFGRRLDSSGVPQSSEFLVNTEVAGLQGSAALASSAGRWVATWRHLGPGSIRARSSVGPAFSSIGDLQINTSTASGYLRSPSIARTGSGFVVAWQNRYQDGSDDGIFARRLTVIADLDVDGNGVVQPLTDALLVLRYAFGFRGATLVTGAVGGGCTRCDAAAIEAYLAGKL